MRTAKLTYCVLCMVALFSACTAARRLSVSARKTVLIPKDFLSVRFSHDGRRVAFGTLDGGQFRVIVDSKPEQLYESVTVVEFSPQGDHYYYGGQRDGQWYLVRDGKEITRLGSLFEGTQDTGLFLLSGESALLWHISLDIWFAEQSDSYFVPAYQDGTGKVFKDGAWLPLEYRSIPQGMAINADGKHYAISVGPMGQAHMYLNGELISSQFDLLLNATFLQPGNRLIYIGTSGGGTHSYLHNMQMMLKDKPFPGVGPLAGMIITSRDGNHFAAPAGMIVTSRDGNHFAALVEAGAGQQAVAVDGKQEATYPKMQPGSFAWSKDGTAHAYVVNVASEKEGPQAVIHNGTALNRYPEIRSSSLVLSPDGKHAAYAAKGNEGWTVVVDNTARASFEEIGNILFAGTGGKVVYTAKTSKGWSVYGDTSSQPFEAVDGLVSDASGAHFAYAAKTSDAKWQVFVDGKPVGAPCDGIVGWTGIRLSESGDVSFTAKMGDQLVWFETNPQ